MASCVPVSVDGADAHSSIDIIVAVIGKLHASPFYWVVLLLSKIFVCFPEQDRLLFSLNPLQTHLLECHLPMGVNHRLGTSFVATACPLQSPRRTASLSTSGLRSPIVQAFPYSLPRTVVVGILYDLRR